MLKTRQSNSACLFVAYLLFLAFALNTEEYFAYAQKDDEKVAPNDDTSSIVNIGPKIIDPNLKVEIVTKGLEFPTTMAFLGPNDILVLEKNEGTVKRIVNGQILDKPLLDVNVATSIERGMLGIAVAKNENDDINKPPYVFLYFTESEKEDGEDMSSEQKAPLGNRLYRYELINDKLVNPKLLLDLPAWPHAAHDGGRLAIGPDNNLYITIGDLKGNKDKASITAVQNVQDGSEPDGRAGILRSTFDGQPVATDAIIGENDPLYFYYAYGIRNSFGIAFDPLTGKLWDTENGPGFGDEINLVEPGFNSGWMKVQGVWTVDEDLRNKAVEIGSEDPPAGLVNFDGKGIYSNPEFTWEENVGPTAIAFLSTNNLGAQYQNDMFVADFNNGNIYHFDLNKDRTRLLLKGPLLDGVANSTGELQSVIFAQGLGAITDIEVGPDGYIYILSLYQGGESSCNDYDETNCLGTLFKISPSGDTSTG